MIAPLRWLFENVPDDNRVLVPSTTARLIAGIARHHGVTAPVSKLLRRELIRILQAMMSRRYRRNVWRMKKKTVLRVCYLNVIHVVEGLDRQVPLRFLERGKIRLRHPISSVGNRMYLRPHRAIRIGRYLWTTIIGDWSDLVIRGRVLTGRTYFSHSRSKQGLMSSAFRWSCSRIYNNILIFQVYY